MSLTKCPLCHKGLNSSYIRVGSKESFRKTGVYCIACDIYYSPNLTKQYTVNEKQYTIYNYESRLNSSNNLNISSTNPTSNNKSENGNQNIQNLYGPGRMQVIIACNLHFIF